MDERLLRRAHAEGGGVNGKGDTRRPTDVPEDEVARRWAQTFREQMRKIQADDEALQKADPLYAAFIRQVGD
ncbi:MAG: hypothetical protein ACK5X3_14790 [Pseudomonadota bacterium]